MIAVMGAAGNIGRRISEQLLDAGERIRALGRSAEKLASLKSRGAEVLAGDARDAAFLASAFRGSEGIYTSSHRTCNPPTTGSSRMRLVKRSPPRSAKAAPASSFS